MSTNYLNVKRRYFANLGIHPSTSSNHLTTSPPRNFSFSPPSTQFPISTNCDSSDSEGALSLSATDIFSEDSTSSSSSIDNAFEMQLDDIFKLEEDIVPCSSSVPVDIPIQMSPKIERKTKDIDIDQTFVPPHLVSRSLYSS
eukprot:CAMPEP_0206200470 /NCGR_PEP_ID=MMETSP0166-20121206/10902_1 /ASSEMBLY_ACC=CAM_ASM_000260 /TAXON_ID=95228 /ORGANISM="Vannella robusta, Strain DIVA3 518/3/11/1/6" /LENGTH=141 /DNA_ID=CAMNT_0053618821 /DNA_START=178 /DNA_END=600 /DNA_ORIENTATION=-